MVAWVGSNKYDAFNQLIATKSAGGSIESRYNGEGYRTVKTANGVTTYGLYEGDKLVLETDNSGKEKVRTTYGLNAINRTDNGDKVFYLYNPHADVVNLVSGSSVVATYAYDAFGNPISAGEWSEINDTKKAGIRYAGYQYDSESGYYYLNARMYDPKTARFLQEDTYRGSLTDPLSLNLYTYCHNDPVQYTDPTGHKKHKDRPTGVNPTLKKKIGITKGNNANNSGGKTNNSGGNYSIDPSGTYYPDGSFTPKNPGNSGGGSRNRNNGSLGTVSKEVMDEYYASFEGMTNDKERKNWSEAAQGALADIGRNTSNKKPTDDLSPKENSIIDLFYSISVNNYVNARLLETTQSTSKMYKLANGYYSDVPQGYMMPLPGQKIASNMIWNPQDIDYYDAKLKYLLPSTFEMVGKGVNFEGSGLNIGLSLSMIKYEKDKFDKTIHNLYGDWDKPFVYSNFGIDSGAIASVEYLAEFCDAMMRNKNTSKIPGFSVSYSMVFRRKNFEERYGEVFTPDSIRGNGMSYGGTYRNIKITCSPQCDDNAYVETFGASSSKYDVNFGISNAQLIDKRLTDPIFEPSESDYRVNWRAGY